MKELCHNIARGVFFIFVTYGFGVILLTATLTAAPIPNRPMPAGVILDDLVFRPHQSSSVDRLKTRTCTAEESKEIDKASGHDEFGNILLPFYLNEKQLDGIINRDGAVKTALPTRPHPLHTATQITEIHIPRGHKVKIYCEGEDVKPITVCFPLVSDK